MADQQKFNHRFRVVKPADTASNTAPEATSPRPKGPGPFLKSGLWKYSRQPNYFGEILLWWGMFILCLSAVPGNSATYVSILSPVFITVLLLFLSGIPLAEAGYQVYLLCLCVCG